MRTVAAILVVLASCSSATLVPVEPQHALPAYEGAAIALFDDGIDTQPPSAGFEPGSSPVDSERLRERTQLGDCVARVRVVTITSTQSEGGASWQIGLHTLETLGGKSAALADWTLRVDDQGEAASTLRVLGGRLIERPFIVFIRRFARAAGGNEGELHFHLAADEGDQLGAVRVAALLAQVR
jgi:hypothetical protein